MPGYYGQVATTEKFSLEEESPSVAVVVRKPDTVIKDDKERINVEINSKGMVMAEMRKERAMKGINSHNIKIPDFSLPKKLGLILIENDVLSTLAEIDDGISSGSILRHPTMADLEKVAESKRLAKMARLLGLVTCLQGDNDGRSYRSNNNYPIYSDLMQGLKGFKGDQVQGPKCNHVQESKLNHMDSLTETQT